MIDEQAKEQSRSDAPARGDSRAGIVALLGGAGLLLAIAVYSNIREQLGALQNQRIDLIFAIGLVAAIYALVIAARPSWMALMMVTLALLLFVGWGVL